MNKNLSKLRTKLNLSVILAFISFMIWYDFHIENHPIPLLVLGGAMIFSFLILMIYYWIIFSKLAFYKKRTSINQVILPKVSVVISARNEYLNLKENLPLICSQDYPDYEVLIVDDHSQDDTYELLCDLKLVYRNLKIIRLIDPHIAYIGKKFPLSVGINAASNPMLLLTDADCCPSGPKWIREVVGSYSNDTEIVLGYGKFYRRRGFLNKLIRFDTMQIAMYYLSAALCGFPYMGVGRNLSYKTRVFQKSDGFIKHLHLPSGDDDLFISSVANKKNCNIVVKPESFTFSHSKRSFLAYWIQKRRHLTTGMHYRPTHKLYLALFPANVLLFPALAFILVLVQYNLAIVIALVFLKILSQWIITGRVAKKLKERKLLLISPFMEFISTSINLAVILSNMVKKPRVWK